MVESILLMLKDVLLTCVAVFQSFVTGNLWSFFVTMFLMFVAVRFLILPIIGFLSDGGIFRMGSDSVSSGGSRLIWNPRPPKSGNLNASSAPKHLQLPSKTGLASRRKK